jgi:hypothetical protein
LHGEEEGVVFKWVTTERILRGLSFSYEEFELDGTYQDILGDPHRLRPGRIGPGQPPTGRPTSMTASDADDLA